jgi:hypothetical protein
MFSAQLRKKRSAVMLRKMMEESFASRRGGVRPCRPACLNMMGIFF